jgi:hypothetical protein
MVCAAVVVVVIFVRCARSSQNNSHFFRAIMYFVCVCIAWQWRIEWILNWTRDHIPWEGWGPAQCESEGTTVVQSHFRSFSSSTQRIIFIHTITIDRIEPLFIYVDRSLYQGRRKILLCCVGPCRFVSSTLRWRMKMALELWFENRKHKKGSF